MIRTVRATRYVAPLREGGSLPGIVEADDDGLYVVKFRGAGQGAKALIAELVGGEIARALGLLVPEIVFIEVDPMLGRSEPDQEIQELIQSSVGLNLALDYLPGALGFDPLLDPPAHELASAIVWLDAYITNVDRTPRNTNMLIWHRRLWLVDHGASLYFQHNWDDYLTRSRGRFPQIRDHVLLPRARMLAEADAQFSARLTPELLGGIVALIPDSWLGGERAFESPAAQRAAFVEFLLARLEAPRAFLEEALNARA
ncbi:MAG: aminotransferase class I and II [Ardenticatenales bacterium]|nr:aminotransferase class I and II [Ardenticatenales bacterium]